jgi:hypothetical protein
VKPPATMTAGEINRELDSLDIKASLLTDRFIAEGRGHETSLETWRLTDPLAREWQALQNRRWALRAAKLSRVRNEALSRRDQNRAAPRKKPI